MKFTEILTEINVIKKKHIKIINKLIEEICDNNHKETQINTFETLKVAKKVLEKFKIDYWLGYGTLIGCIRHSGFIPWDDDIDICVLEKELVILNNIDWVKYEIEWVKFHDDLYRIIHKGWQIDIFILKFNYEKNLEMTVDEIFPLKKGRFNGIKFNIPNYPDNFFLRKYQGVNPMKKCSIWNHKINNIYEKEFEFEKFTINFEDLEKKWKKYKI